MHPDLQEAIEFHNAIIAEGSKALVGYDTAKALANIVLLSEIPTTYDKSEQRQVNAGNLLLRVVPGVGTTFFGVILAAISDARFARLQGRADLQPTEVVGFQMINPATGALVTEFGPLASPEVILLDEINRIPMKSQSAFLEALQDRTITVGKETYQLPAFSFAIATMNPVELGQGTFPLSEAATDRFAIMINIGYLPPEEEEKLVDFDFKRVRLDMLLSRESFGELRSRLNEQAILHDRLKNHVQQLVGATTAPARSHHGRAPEPLPGLGVRLHRAQGLAGGRPTRVHRLGTVVVDRLLAAHHPRVRTAEHGDRHRHRRPLAVHAMRRSGRPHRRGDRPGHRHHRDVVRLFSGSVRAGHLRRRFSPSGGTSSAHRQEPRRALPRRLPIPARPSIRSTKRQHQHVARRLRAPSDDAPRRLGLSLR